MKIINPATEATIREIKTDDSESLEKKYKRLRNAQPRWQAFHLETGSILLSDFPN